MIPLSERAFGRWKGILPQLGLSPTYLTGKHTACPICSQGKDRFRFDDKGKGMWICAQCGAGSGPELVMRVNGWSFKEAAQRIEAVIGDAGPANVEPERPADAKRDALRRMWRGSVPVTAGDPVALWLANRAGVQAVPSCLRYVRRAVYMDGDSRTFHPAMVSLVQAADGSPTNLHRTFLTTDGAKAAVDAPRRMMEGSVPPGAAVRLFPPGPVMGIAEGIETAFAAAAMFSVPVWAGINANGLRTWEPPAECREVIVFGDHDATFTGQAAAFALGQRLANDQRRPLAVRVEIPPGVGQDWNDVMREK